MPRDSQQTLDHTPVQRPPAQRPCAGQRPYGVTVICTRDRPDEIAMSCAAVYRASPDMPILVVDASTTDETRKVCEDLIRQPGTSRELLHRRASRPGLARQRNEAVQICRELDVQMIHFIDDDTEVSSGYFDAIEKNFQDNPSTMGIGGIVLNQPRVRYLPAKRFFLLGSRRRGAVLRSGRNMIGQYPEAAATDCIDWLCGCSMSYRTAAFDDQEFDGRLAGYSLGEDYDFSFRLSRRHKLAVEPSATCVHHFTPTQRYPMRIQARQRTQITYCWVREHRKLGFSKPAFWWSTLGDAALHAGHWILTGDRKSLQETFGIIDAVINIARNQGRLNLETSSSL